MKSICFLYGDSPGYAKEKGLVQDVLANDEIVIAAGALDFLEKNWSFLDRVTLMDKAYRYLDYWGSSVYSNEDVDYFRWQPSPGDIGDLPIRTGRDVYCYRIDGLHTLNFARWVFSTANLRCKGVFLDDWDGDRWYWNLDGTDKDKIWKGWRKGRNWNLSRLHRTEIYCRALTALRGKKVIVNGSGRKSAPRLFESFGDWIDVTQIENEAKPNDVILVKGIASDGVSWARVTNIYGGFEVGTSFKDVFKKAMELAEKYDLRLGLCYHDKPYIGSSTCNVHAWTSPHTWNTI